MNSSVLADVLCTKVRCFANTVKSLATSWLIFSTVLWSTFLLLAAFNAPGSYLCWSRREARCIRRRLRSTVFGLLSAKKVSGKGYISHAARFDDKVQRMGPAPMRSSTSSAWRSQTRHRAEDDPTVSSGQRRVPGNASRTRRSTRTADDNAVDVDQGRAATG